MNRKKNLLIILTLMTSISIPSITMAQDSAPEITPKSNQIEQPAEAAPEQPAEAAPSQDNQDKTPTETTETTPTQEPAPAPTQDNQDIQESSPTQKPETAPEQKEIKPPEQKPPSIRKTSMEIPGLKFQYQHLSKNQTYTHADGFDIALFGIYKRIYINQEPNPEWVSYWHWGTLAFILPYIGGGVEYNWDNGWKVGLATIYIVPYIYTGITW